ncbi:MAG: carbon-nitrogen hydrolase family protein, partial [Planctomycetota bacterium]|nr:carbon-nitrogen hydrolase family protein [Planctomycetota bacterium]
MTMVPRRVRIGLIQMTVDWSRPEGNILRAEELIGHAAKLGADIVALPECFVRPPRMYAEPVPGPLTKRFGEIARRNRVHLVMGSIGERDGRRIYNTACLLDDRGRLLGRYRKRFLWWTERLATSRGDLAPVFRTRLGPIGLALCWDLAFPEHFRELALAGARIVVCPAYWQAGDRFGRLKPGCERRIRKLARAEHFFVDACVGARAAENAMAIAFVNAAGRTRTEAGADRLIGHTQVAGPLAG